jgi:GH15 family glucan-1,4-alpha-glucosidase
LIIQTRQLNEYSPIEDYAVLTDGRAAALISKDGRIDWWPVPTMDAPPVCASILDAERGGYISVAPDIEFQVERRYVAHTNVLESVMTTVNGSIRVTSALNMASVGRPPWTELAFRIEGLTGEVAMRWSFIPGSQFETVTARCSLENGTAVIKAGTHTIVSRFDGDADTVVSANEVTASFSVKSGSRTVVAFVATRGEPVTVPSVSDIDSRIDATVEVWSQWSASIAPPERWSEVVTRSALLLKTLIAEDTGAISAAATTSLPERIGGPKNWDYRYSWIRDSSFVIDAFLNLGLDEEVQNTVSWLLAAIKDNGPELHVFYTLAGGITSTAVELDATGYRNSRPVHCGNGASNQLQLGNYGDVFDSVYRYLIKGNVLDVTSEELLRDLVGRCCDEWMEPDSGIWELNDIEQYTISKISCWVALDRAVKLFERGHIHGGDIARWRQERDAVRAFVRKRCWSTKRNSYSFYADTDELDASVLLCARTGFDVGPRLVSTIEAISRELRHGAFVYRYTRAEESEGAFVACTFWLVEALAAVGQREAATLLMDEGVRLVNDVGVLAEQIDVSTGAFLGNVPQALSHLALINAAYSLWPNRFE